MRQLKRLARTSLLLLVFHTCALACFAQVGTGQGVYQPPQPSSTVEYDPSSWKAFSSEDGRFSIMSPVELRKRSQTVAAKNGQSEVHLYQAYTFASYQVMYMDLKESLEDAKRARRAFDEGRDGARHVKGQILEEKEIKLDGHAGRALKVRTGNGNIIRSRMYAVGNRFYIISILTSKNDDKPEIARFYEEVASKFLDSFKLTR